MSAGGYAGVKTGRCGISNRFLKNGDTKDVRILY